MKCRNNCLLPFEFQTKSPAFCWFSRPKASKEHLAIDRFDRFQRRTLEFIENSLLSCKVDQQKRPAVTCQNLTTLTLLHFLPLKSFSVLSLKIKAHHFSLAVRCAGDASRMVIILIFFISFYCTGTNFELCLASEKSACMRL